MSTELIGKEMLVHSSTPDGCYMSRDHTIYFYNYATSQLKKVCRLPPANPGLKSLIKDKLARSFVAQWLRKSPGIWHLISDKAGRLIVIYDKIYIFTPRQNSDLMEVIPQVDNESGFLSPLRGGCAIHDESQKVYFGEYINGKVSAIRVMCIDTAQKTFAACYEFAPNEIKHIHSISYDRFRNRLWITTGDSDLQSAFYFTDDEFKTVHRFAGGDQSWRAVGLLFDKHGFEWGMDAGKDARACDINKIYRFDFRTGKRTELAVIGNPAYYIAQVTDGTAWMATTFEPGRLQETPEEAALWFRNAEGRWQLSHQFPYESHRREGVSKYAQILLPYGSQPIGTLCITPINTAGNFSSLRLFQ